MEWKLSYDNCKWRHFQQTGFQTTTSILYKIKSISLGVEYIHNPKPNRTYASIKTSLLKKKQNGIILKFNCS